MLLLVRVYKVMRPIQQQLPETLGQTPSVRNKQSWVLLCALPYKHSCTGPVSFTSDSKCLASGHEPQDWDLNPYSTDQKHQSFSPASWAAWPQVPAYFLYHLPG